MVDSLTGCALWRCGARLQELELVGLTEDVDTTTALAGMLWVQDHQPNNLPESKLAVLECPLYQVRWVLAPRLPAGSAASLPRHA